MDIEQLKKGMLIQVPAIGTDVFEYIEQSNVDKDYYLFKVIKLNEKNKNTYVLLGTEYKQLGVEDTKETRQMYKALDTNTIEQGFILGKLVKQHNV